MALFGGTGNDSLDFSGGRATGFVDTGSGSDSVLRRPWRLHHSSGALTGTSRMLVLELNDCCQRQHVIRFP